MIVVWVVLGLAGDGSTMVVGVYRSRDAAQIALSGVPASGMLLVGRLTL